MTKTRVALSGVPEMMLWTLHNRASGARGPSPILADPLAVRLCDSIDYDYEGRFGVPDGSHALRARLFDDALRPWISAHPGGVIVELACGLETQFHRVDDGSVRWICLDVAEAMDVRDRLLPPPERCTHLRQDARDLSWMDAVDESKGVFVTAQGLFMYLEETEVRRILTAIIERFSGVDIMFDVIPRWTSKRTLKGWRKTKTFQLPPMPWGIDRHRIAPTLCSWCPSVRRIDVIPYGWARGARRLLMPLILRMPIAKNASPNVVRVVTSPTSRPS